jgi:uncharacterized protein
MTKGASVKPVKEHLKLLKELWHDRSVLHRYLQHNSIDECNEKGETLLLAACADSKSSIGSSDTPVKLILQAGADCNLSSAAQGFTPLMLAQTADIASCLLDNGADIEMECNEGRTALHLACKGGQLAVAKVLLKRGAEQHILKSSNDGSTPLSTAIKSHEVDITMLLLQHLLEQTDFDINHPTLVLDEPLICAAAWSGMCKVVEAALDHGAFINAAGPHGTALKLAAHACHYDIVSLLCERGAELNARCSRMQMSGVEAALMRGNVRIIKKLIKHGADSNAVSPKSQMCPLMQAAMLGKCGVLAALLQAGAHFDAVLQYKCLSSVSLHLQDSAAAAEVLKVLLPYCSNLDQPLVGNDDNALTYALTQGSLYVARALRAAGADVHCSIRGRTAAHAAAQSGSVAVVKWVQSLGVDLRGLTNSHDSPLHCACYSTEPDAAKYLLDLLEAADDVHARNVDQQTPLYYAADSAADSVVQLLLQRGAAVNARDASNTTPLMHAKSAAVVKLLLAAGADAAAADISDNSVLHYLANSGVTAGAICLLLRAGADPTAVDNNGSTAAHIAGMSGHFALEALLSRAAVDYGKKHTTAVVFTDTASRGSSSSSSTDSGNVAFAVTATSTTQQQQQQSQECSARKAKQPCAHCSKPTAKRCRRCAAVYYCSVECQKVCFADPQHRAQCKAKAAESV